MWEPILATDWGSPSQSALGRIPDPRVRQFWDPEHRVSQELSRIRAANRGQPEPDCCVKDGFYWDLAILYAPRSRWGTSPAAVYWNGPVWQILPALEKAMRELK